VELIHFIVVVYVISEITHCEVRLYVGLSVIYMISENSTFERTMYFNEVLHQIRQNCCRTLCNVRICFHRRNSLTELVYWFSQLKGE
jgi:hypothetical protein